MFKKFGMSEYKIRVTPSEQILESGSSKEKMDLTRYREITPSLVY